MVRAFALATKSCRREEIDVGKVGKGVRSGWHCAEINVAEIREHMYIPRETGDEIG